MISKALVVGAYHQKLVELTKLGIDVHVVIPKSWGHQFPEITKGNGYSIHFLPVYLSGENHFHFYSDLKKTVQSVRPDVLHIDEEPYSVVTYQAMRLAKGYSISSLFFTWQNIYKRYPFPFSWFEIYNYSHASVAIAGNNEALNVLQRKGFAKEIFVIPQFGVDLCLYTRRDSSALKRELFSSSEAGVIGYVGRLVEEKGIMDLIEAFSKVKRNIYLLIVGNGPLEHRISVRAAQLDILKRVKIIPHVPSDRIPEYLNVMDCLVLPSRTRTTWKEQFGRVLIEAMACEVPVVGSTSGEIPHTIGNAGLLFEESNIDDLYQKISLILSNSQLKKQLRHEGRRRVGERFTQRHIAAQTLEVYKKILQEN
ncbi:MAG: glycosyltransferase family 4 protein [Ignavibacteriae bacterium]|nr:glycosyltransferase family 4 protein [Ignavibacteriota bacterium]